MSTTAIFVELLIAGMQASVWVTLFVISITGYDWVSYTLSELKGWVVLVTAILFAVWYTLGIVVDQLANVFVTIIINPKKLLLKFRWVNQRHHQKNHIVRQRAAIAFQAGSHVSFLEFIRSRLRIMRSTAFNTLLIMVSTLFFILTKCDILGCASKWGLVVATVIIGTLLEIILLFILGYLDLGYALYFDQINQELAETKKKEQIAQ